MQKMKAYVCAHCGISFKRVPRKCRPPKYCSPKCASSHRDYRASAKKKVHPDKVCPHCNQTFTPKRLKQRMCSEKCRDDSLRVRRPRECALCGASFHAAGTSSRFCTLACKQAFNAWLMESDAPLRGNKKRICEYCGAAFTSPHAKKFCCQVCQLRAKREKGKAAKSSRSAWYTPKGERYPGWARLNFGPEVNPLGPQVYPFNNMEIPYDPSSCFALEPVFGG